MTINPVKVILLLILSIPALSQDQWKDVYSRSSWPERDTWQKPAEIIKMLSLKAGDKTADLGCHEGYFSFKLSHVVGASGVVYGVDLDQRKLDRLKAYAEQQQIHNIITVMGKTDDPLLPTQTLDAVLIVDSYHEMKAHDQILKHIFDALKPGGRLIICEPIAEQRRKLSREEQERNHELDMSYALTDLQKFFFRIIYKKDRYIDREKIKGDKMWIIVARKK